MPVSREQIRITRARDVNEINFTLCRYLRTYLYIIYVELALYTLYYRRESSFFFFLRKFIYIPASGIPSTLECDRNLAWCGAGLMPEFCIRRMLDQKWNGVEFFRIQVYTERGAEVGKFFDSVQRAGCVVLCVRLKSTFLWNFFA